MSARRVVVTGGTGHLGPNLVRALLERGDTVRVLTHRAEPPDVEGLVGLDVERCAGDVLDPDALRRCFEGAEVVFHLAARISIRGDEGGQVTRVNVEGARHAAEASLAAGVRRHIHVASVHAFTMHPLDVPIDETRTRALGPRHAAYDRSKALGEIAVREVVARGLDAVILHPSGVIGPADVRPSRIGQVLLDLYHRRLPSLTPGGFDWVDVRDVVASILAAADRGRTNESYILSGHWQSIVGLSRMLTTLTGVPGPRLSVPMWLARLGAPLMSGIADLTGREPLYTAEGLDALEGNQVYLRDKAERELGHVARPTEETIHDLFDWFDTHGRLNPRLGPRGG